MVIFTESKAHFACAAVTSRMIDTTLMAGVMSSNAFIMILEKSKKEKNSKGAAVNFIAAIVTQIQTSLHLSGVSRRGIIIAEKNI